MGTSPAIFSGCLLVIPLRTFGVRFAVESFPLRHSILACTSRLVSEKPSWRWSCCCKCRRGGENGYTREEPLIEGEDYIVVNFYSFVLIRDPVAEVEKHLAFLKELDIHGRIYLNEQGINAQYSGPSKEALAYVQWLRGDERFSDVLVQTSPAVNGHAFPKLKLRYKPSLVQYEGGISHLPLLDPSMRAKPLEPSEWRRKLEQVMDNGEAASPSTVGSNCILLDVRNGYEWDIGHFRGALRPEVDCFRSTSFGLSEEKDAPPESDPLTNVDKEKTDILMYCTGGIRCDVYSTILRQRGFKNLYTLKGGVSHYLEEQGTAEWVGNLFVFDSRLSLPPSAYSNRPVDATSSNPVFARCYICDSQVNELRHRNCANLDCNLLFLCCADCVVGLKGCCCPKCTTAPRLRPVLYGERRYRKWHIYRDSNVQNPPSV
ncbi:PREDICTED: rhodanese-like domain-containing protein 8, chloroplastic [Tarenaya hassleriana]|uniref:rhodanese-like domain-containing protein 8, chloroplastic n=1 Tax=Tarenaya hassleriana TaxID=28532 RepID=UPI00053C19DA|nr:PREDICTED: rhodanese-like domain-containing protein 8, chloroplastic [Tarenaya hassleriana]